VHSTTNLWIGAPPRELFDLVSDLGRWEEALPHYRYVRILSRRDGTTHAAMSARRGWIPVFWEAVQTVDPEACTIRFRHVRGVTRGMEVLWSFTPERGGTRARVDHDLDFRVPLVGRWLAERIIAREFIEPIVAKTLGRFRALAEARTAAEARTPAEARPTSSTQVRAS
jgi:ribosome-associated toxin RatA of RatAB toxin-antitoxin module